MENKVINYIIKSEKHGNHTIKFDAIDYDFISSMKWYLMPRRDKTGKFYVYRNMSSKEKKKRKTIYLHRELLGVTDPKIEVDHKDNDTLNFCRNNLRESTRQTNAMNQIVNRANNTSGYKGVCWDKKARKWMSTIWINRKQKHLGYFLTPEEAALKYNEMARKYFGEFAKLNIIEANNGRANKERNNRISVA